jgi:DNA modification methylase
VAAVRAWEGNTDLRKLLVPVGELRRHPSNPRRGDMDAIRASLRRFGQQRPVLALPDGTIVAGNHTFQGTVDEGWTHCAVVRSDLTEAEVDAYLAADNRTGDLGTYDDEVLARLLQPLYDDGFVERLVARVDPARESDDAPPVPDVAKSTLGEVYELGTHRLICGDSTSSAALSSLLGTDEVRLIVTDPPYGVNYQGDEDPESLRRRNRRPDGRATVANDSLGEEGTRNLVVAALGCALERTAKGASFYVFAPSGPPELWFRLALQDLSLELRQVIVWAKDVFVFGRQDYHWRHETILYGWKAGAARTWHGGRDQDTVWECPRPKRSEEHPTMKPVELVERCVRNSSDRDVVVLDPFAGSGTTLIACENLGRRAALVELDPRYCDVIRQRYADYVGDQSFAP